MAKARGSAQINIELKDSVITVRHTHPKGDILYSKEAVDGDWDKIWEAIYEDPTEELLVYGIDANRFDGKIFELTNNDFVHIAEGQGNVWSLIGFESAFNSEEIGLDVFIRFIHKNEQL